MPRFAPEQVPAVIHPPRGTRAAAQRNTLAELGRSMGNQAVQRLVEANIQRHAEGTAHNPGMAKTRQESWEILSIHPPRNNESLEQYVDRLLLAHTLTDDLGTLSEREYLLQQAEDYYPQNFSKKVAAKRIEAKNQAATAKQASAEKQKREKEQAAKEKEKERLLTTGSKDAKKTAKAKIEKEETQGARNERLQLIQKLTAKIDRPWANKQTALIPRRGMSNTGQNKVLAVLPTIMEKLTPKIGEIGRTAGAWHTRDEFVKLTLQETGQLDSHIRIDLEGITTIDGQGFYGKLRIQGKDDTWGGVLFQFNKAELQPADFEEAIRQSLKNVGNYACIYDGADNPPIPGDA